MKTGGTMNFLKRAGAILMVVAIFASSCNKYADDFKQLNTKLDAVASSVAGLTQLATDVAATKASVTALQTSVAGLRWGKPAAEVQGRQPFTRQIRPMTPSTAGFTMTPFQEP